MFDLSTAAPPEALLGACESLTRVFSGSEALTPTFHHVKIRCDCETFDAACKEVKLVTEEELLVCLL